MLFGILLLGLIHALYGSSHFDCPSGWTRYGEECWLASTKQKSWDEAYEFCSAQTSNGTFIDIKDQEENDAVTSMLKGSNLEYWCGLEVGRTTVPYEFGGYSSSWNLRWNTTGDIATGYKNFKGSMNYQSSSYQNGYRSTSYTSRYCGYVDDNGSWYLTTNCNLRKQFICQKETDCLRGYFGESCNQTCNCYKSNCDRATGVCPYGCSRGWTGDECNIEKKPAEVAVYCMKESEREQYALIRMDLKSVDYDEIYILDDNDTILCNKSVFTPDVDGIYNLKIDLLSNDSDCYPEVFEGKFKMTIRTEEIEGFLNAYDRKFELDCDWNGFEKMSRSKQQTLLEEPMAHLKGVGIEGRPETVRLVIQDPSTKTAISKIKIGAKIQLAMILDTRSSSMSAKGISPYNCKCSTSDGKISHALTDSNGCPLKNSPIYLLESDSTPSRVISNTFDAFTIEGRSDILFQCQFDYCFHSSPHSKCPNRCLYSRSRRLIRRSVNRLNGMSSATRITVHDN